MTSATKDFSKIPDYIDLVDSSEHKTTLELRNFSLSSCANAELPPLLLQLSHDLKSSNKMLNTTSALEDKTSDDAKQHYVYGSLQGSNSRPLPLVKPPYYNLSNELGNNKGNNKGDKSLHVDLNTKGANQRPSYGHIPSAQTRPELNSYTELNCVSDHYDLLAPVQRSDMPKVDVANSQYETNAVSKKCVILSVCCILVALLFVMVATLSTVFVARDQIDHIMDARMTSLRKFQDEMNAKVLDTVKAIHSEKASDLTAVYANICYCLYRKKLSWKDAKDFCLAKGNGVHLAEIHSKEENDFLMPILQAAGTDLGIWLGGSDLDKEGEWVWSYTAEPIKKFVPSQWAAGQPSNSSPRVLDENCLDVFDWDRGMGVQTYKWNDHHCDDSKPFVCRHCASIQSRCFC